MKKFLSLIAMSITFCSWTQITVTESDFPSGGDTALVTISDDTSIDLVLTGANTNWDFSGVSIDDQKIHDFSAMSEAESFYQFVFNNQFSNPDYACEYFTPWMDGVDFSQGAAFGLDIQDPVVFTKTGASKIEIPGFGLKINGFPVPAPSDTIDIQYELPMNYSDSWVSFSYTNLDMNPQFDAIWRRHQQRYSIVDGWGQITTPFKTYDVLRVKSLIVAQDSVYFNFGGSGQWFELPTPDQIDYDWIAIGEKVSVFKVVTQDIGGNYSITSVEFKDKKRDFASTSKFENEVGVYPNPTANNVTVSTENTPNEIQIIDLSGKVIQSFQPSSEQSVLDVSDLNAGLYLIKILSENKVETVKLKVL